ncbi:Aste57867_19953 [Aphanomyces stellatus]|uniref:Aste57867_19953 protein n=1 Tax=Aphanomyces stellatus TaxID=120398 RepID=A0A485LDW0_9STRA|nr:hypothetical protein As57867_019887 [Aphanomyces stellatus]VFT96650.1 Aste57867_19953 [Aphanomyces stellatus]
MLRRLAASKRADYIIVGGGSAGCVLANRLSEHNRVLLVEAGPSDKGKWDSVKIQMPAALTFNLADTRYNWGYKTVPQAHLDNRRLEWPRGRVLGGSSSLNAMVYIRGHAQDYDDWDAAGAAGWSYADCLPYFKKAQSHELGEDTYRGGSGPLHVSRGSQKSQVLFQAFIDAGVQAGYPFTDDMNGYQQEGFGFMDSTIYKGERWSASAAYLPRAVRERENLTILTDQLVHRIVLDGTTARGIHVQSRGGDVELYEADKEVIVCGGAVNSPQLLLLSGIGPADDLHALGIPVTHPLAAVGQHLEDHLDLYIQFGCTQPITLHNATWKYPHKMVAIALEWLVNRTGLGASAHLESGGFIRSRAGLTHPDLQFHFLPGALTGQLTPGACHAMQSHLSPMRATSRGTLTLTSTDPKAPPRIDPKYLSTTQDVEDIRRGVLLTQEIFQQKAFDPFRGEPISPATVFAADADDTIDAWVRCAKNFVVAFVRQNTESAYHPSCTNRMGNDVTTSVVNSQCQVHGLDRLRIVDASIMPNIISGNLNAPVIMMAEKAADLILGKPPLPPATDVPVYIAPHCATRQR